MPPDITACDRTGTARRTILLVSSKNGNKLRLLATYGTFSLAFLPDELVIIYPWLVYTVRIPQMSTKCVFRGRCGLALDDMSAYTAGNFRFLGLLYIRVLLCARYRTICRIALTAAVKRRRRAADLTFALVGLPQICVIIRLYRQLMVAPEVHREFVVIAEPPVTYLTFCSHGKIIYK